MKKNNLARIASLALVALAIAAPAYASGSGMPWEGPLQQILDSITGPVARAVGELMATLRRDGTTAAYRRRMLRFDEFNALVGLNQLRATEAEKQDFARDLMERAKGYQKRAAATAGRKRRK